MGRICSNSTQISSHSFWTWPSRYVCVHVCVCVDAKAHESHTQTQIRTHTHTHTYAYKHAHTGAHWCRRCRRPRWVSQATTTIGTYNSDEMKMQSHTRHVYIYKQNHKLTHIHTHSPASSTMQASLDTPSPSSNFPFPPSVPFLTWTSLGS